MGGYYDMPYWSGSQSTHGSAIAVDRNLDIGADGLPNYKVGLSAPRLDGELAVCCDLLRTLALLNDVCKLELNKLCADLLPEYKPCSVATRWRLSMPIDVPAAMVR